MLRRDSNMSGSVTNRKKVSNTSGIFSNNSGSISESLGRGLKTSMRVLTEMVEAKIRKIVF